MHGSRGRRRRLAQARRRLYRISRQPATLSFWKAQKYDTAIAAERMDIAMRALYGACEKPA